MSAEHTETSALQAEINRELERIAGGPGAECELRRTGDAGDTMARIETARSVYEFPCRRLLETLREVEDDVGVMALRSRLDRLAAGRD